MLKFAHTVFWIICCSLIPVTHAAMVKWVDENGQVHYGERVPPKYLKQERTILNDRGVVVRHIKASKSKEQIEQEKRVKASLDSKQKAELIERRKKALHDRMLLDTFTTENDIKLARDARIDAIDSQVKLTETIIKDHQLKLKDAKDRINQIESSGREAPENMHKKVVSVSRQLENHLQYVETKNVERSQMIEQFDADIKRFRELKLAKQARKAKRNH